MCIFLRTLFCKCLFLRHNSIDFVLQNLSESHFDRTECQSLLCKFWLTHSESDS